MNSYGYQHYKEQSVNTMTAGEMLLLLYDELLKRLTRAEISLKNQDYLVFEQSIQRSIDIVLYFKKTLNHKYQISTELKSMYDFFLYQFSRVKARRDITLIEEVRPLIIELRDAFAQAQKLNS